MKLIKKFTAGSLITDNITYNVKCVNFCFQNDQERFL